MKKFILLLCFLGWANAAQALSCAAPTMEAIVKNDVIFRGTVLRQGESVPPERSMKQETKFIIRVDEAIKAATTKSELEIWRRTYFGDGLVIGQEYIVYAHRSKEGKLEAHVCGYGGADPIYSEDQRTNKHYVADGYDRWQALKKHFNKSDK